MKKNVFFILEAAFREVDEIMGGIDILISNAGISVRRPFMKIDYEQWSKVLRINLDGMFLCAKFVQNAIPTLK